MRYQTVFELFELLSKIYFGTLPYICSILLHGNVLHLFSYKMEMSPSRKTFPIYLDWSWVDIGRLPH